MPKPPKSSEGYAVDTVPNGIVNPIIEHKGKTGDDPLIKNYKSVVIPEINVAIADFMIEGITPLIVHTWTQKAIKEMLAKHMGEPAVPREAKNPAKDYYESMYHLDKDGNITAAASKITGFPTQAFKLCAVSGCRYVKGIPMVAAMGLFHVTKEFTVIEGVHRMRRDMVRVGGKGPGTGAPDIRFRAEYPIWRCKVQFEYNQELFSEGQIANLLNQGGFHTGVGEWRPEHRGLFGRFRMVLGKSKGR